MSQLFGFQINRKDKGRGQSPVPPNADDGVNVAAGGYFGTYVETDAQARNEYDLIKRYRDMSLHPECDSAVDDIVNEFVVSDATDTCVNIDLTNLQVGASVKKRIREEFDYIKRLLGFDMKAHELIRNWYVDGRTYYHKVIDLNDPKRGILELRYIDPLKIRRVRQKIKKADADPTAIRGTALEHEWGDYVDYYIFNPKGYGRQTAMIGGTDFAGNEGIKIAHDAITYVHSGLQDMNKRMHLSFLHKGIKSLNQLRMIEDALVIYRLSRAPERRIFYIDVGNLPKVKAEQYLRDVMNRYRNKLVYDAATGEIRDDKKHMSMLEDFWLPRREGGRGTEITTLPGGQNLGELKDVEYFKKKLYNSLNLPPSRLTDDNKGFNLGKTTEVLRDELKFSKFIGRLRKRFSGIFHDTLKTQLILKGVIAPEDWDEMAEHIQYDYIHDNHFNELKELEMETSRINLVTQMDPYVGKYYSVDYIRRSVLGHKDEDIKEQDKLMSKEIDAGIVADPADLNTFDMMDRQNSAYQPEISAQQADDAHERSLEASKEQAKLKPAPSKTSSNAK
tara:strand:- start:3053 stop:4735 length:1683 start_codon:yes stop_codon:yes gene_type:complete